MDWRICILKRLQFNQPAGCIKTVRASQFPRIPAKGELIQFDGRWYEVSQVTFSLDSQEVQMIVVDSAR